MGDNRERSSECRGIARLDATVTRSAPPRTGTDAPRPAQGALGARSSQVEYVDTRLPARAESGSSSGGINVLNLG